MLAGQNCTESMARELEELHQLKEEIESRQGQMDKIQALRKEKEAQKELPRPDVYAPK